MLDPKWYKAWHAWALANTEVVSHYMKTRSESDTNPIPQAMYTDFLVPAVRGMPIAVCCFRCAYTDSTGFFHSIALSPGKSLQDTLRLLTLWFNYGHQGDVSAAMQEGLGSVSIDTWLEVIPQVCKLSASSNCADRANVTADRSTLRASYQCQTLGTANAGRHWSSASAGTGICSDSGQQISKPTSPPSSTVDPRQNARTQRYTCGTGGYSTLRRNAIAEILLRLCWLLLNSTVWQSFGKSFGMTAWKKPLDYIMRKRTPMRCLGC